jgi:CCR4-NOT transcription complex subunit 4
MQRNLVYVIGLTPALAKEDILKQRQYFGRFGRIVKVAVNKKQVHGDPSRASYSVYVTYRREEDALEAIRALDGETLGGRVIRCTFGTTKYCSMFLRNLPCNNSSVRSFALK